MNILEYNYKSLGELNYSDIKKTLNNKTVSSIAIVSNFATKTEVLNLKELFYSSPSQLYNGWQKAEDNSKHFYRQVELNPQSKVKQITARAQFFLWNKPPKLIAKIAKRLFHLKELFDQREKIDILSKPSNGMYSMASLQHYPIGGGMLGEHSDPDNAIGGLHCLLCLSDRKKDYVKGGLFLRDNGNNKLLDVEDYWHSGDVIVFNSTQLRHGVDPIDPEKKFSWEQAKGRLIFSPVIVKETI